jgi:streptogrisin C
MRTSLARLAVMLGLGACVGEIESPDGAEAPPGLLEAMGRDLGITADEAIDRLTSEATFAHLERQLQSELGDGFGGAWMTDDGRDLIVGIADARLAEIVREAGALPVDVQRSLGELTAVKAVLDAHADEVVGRIHRWYVDPATNSVVVHAADPSDEVVRAFASAGGKAVRVVRSEEAPRPVYDVVGGDELILGGNTLCSVGFAVHGGFVTAGHCGRAGTRTAGANWVDQGVVEGSSFPGQDHAWVRTNSAWRTLPWVGDHRGGAVPVAGSSSASVGSSVCRSGRTTGWRCGVVQAKDVTVQYSVGPVYHTTQTSACAEGGDSGGAFVSGDQAQGVTSGAAGNCSSGGISFFQPVQPILSAYGLGLQTTGGGSSLVSHFNGRCIDVPSSNFSDGVKLQMWDCNGTNAQRWAFVDGTVRAGGLCMDVAWGATHDGALIQLARCSGHLAQQFRVSGAGDLVSVLANKCVDIRDWNGASGAALQIWSCSGNANQKWSVR